MSSFYLVTTFRFPGENFVKCYFKTILFSQFLFVELKIVVCVCTVGKLNKISYFFSLCFKNVKNVFAFRVPRSYISNNCNFIGIFALQYFCKTFCQKFKFSGGAMWCLVGQISTLLTDSIFWNFPHTSCHNTFKSPSTLPPIWFGGLSNRQSG